MYCLDPFYKKLENLRPGESPGPFPCGMCYSCVMRRISGWHFRLSMELKTATSAHFLTLTYNTDYVPIVGCELSLNKLDLQHYFMRLRKKCAIKYYAVGEYGSAGDRPHYHAIIFGAHPDSLVNCWSLRGCSLGHVYLGDVNDQSIGYVTGYVQKSFYREWKQDKAPPFACMSKYLGVNYLTPEIYNWHKADLDNRCLIQLDDRKIAMPRYFKNLIYNDSERKRIAHFSKYAAEQANADRLLSLEKQYGDRASEIDFEQKKVLYKKLQNKKQKRKL